ncbi:hypothetical protein Syun_017295 [Stephania yunnanensis]|uniref:MSP domain-containing protein n=1 Tax=Stephania yunnanensis TaxID=152371 RepID=A0AAP0P2X9_9MAGN
MDRLVSLEPSNQVAVRIEPGQRCHGELTLRNVMYTMPIAFKLQPMNKSRYTIRPQSAVILPLATLSVEITYILPPNSSLPETFPHSKDSFLLHSVVVPGAVKDASSTLDSIPNDWFATRKKQVFIDSSINVCFVGSSILSYLVSKGSMDEIREVLEKSDPSWHACDSIDTQGQTLLHLAIAQSRPDLVQLLLEFEPDIGARNQSGCSPLETASGAGEVLIVELLLARRARTERSESSNWGPIHFAAAGGHLEVMRLLLLKGADVDAKTEDGRTALHLAVEEYHRDCAKLLLASGSRPDSRGAHNGDTALHVAAGLGDEGMVKLLLQKGANKDIRNQNGKTAYDVAADCGQTRLYDALKLGDGLCSAARKGEVRSIHRLLENGASLNGKDQHGWTALHRAAFKGRIDVVRALINKGIDINAKDEDGYTALHCATESGNGEVIELLVKKRADVEARTNKGVTALQIAESLHYSGIARILMQGGASRDDVGSMQAISGSVFRIKSEVGAIKNKSSRTRALQSSFDHSMPLVVL